MKLVRGLVAWLLVLIVLSNCAAPTSVQRAPIDPKPRIAVMSAFQPELKALRDRAQIDASYNIHGRIYTTGRLAGADVVMVMTGVSMVNAAMTTQALLDHFAVQAIVYSGIAGGTNPDLDIGDVVVPKRWGQYQEQLFARETADGWDTGWHDAPFGHFGMMFPQKVSVARGGTSPHPDRDLFWFEVDAEMFAEAQQIVDTVELSRCTDKNVCISETPALITGGNGVSGPTFVDNAAYRKWVWDTFEADAADMETAAMAHVAYANDVPFIAFRSLSDLAGGGAAENEVNAFLHLAADNSAAVVKAFLSAWATRTPPD
ncbi:MAG: 5'-methylthioadenosine/S-adenosylhomocysteine nucleosidase [Anaerolineae bacterium]